MRSKAAPQRKPLNNHKIALFTALAIFAWMALHLYISTIRSIWMDELTRYDQMRFGLKASLKMLMEEPSPFAPGEIFLGQLCKVLFGGWTSLEFWGRIPSVIWGGLTMVLALASGIRFLPLLVFFSVALTSFSTQFRPYSALFFAGALSFRMLWDKRKFSRAENAIAWFTIFFTHLYGICFVAAASALRRDWKKAGVAAAYVATILAVYVRFHHGSVSNWQSANFPGVWGTIKQCLGVMGNPHKASYLLAPLFLYGFYVTARADRKLAAKLGLFFVATVIGPIAATYFGRYFFMPRQVAAGSYGFLALACLGGAALCKRCSSNRIRSAVAVTVAVAVSAVPWALSNVFAIPPFADQPIHHYKEIAHGLEDGRAHRALLVDPGGTLTWYLEEDRGKPGSGGHFTYNGLQLRRICWSELCLIALLDSKYLYGGPELLEGSAAFSRLIRDPKVGVTEIIHAYERFQTGATVPVIRTW